MTADARARSHGEAGFSLVEGLIAALILLFVIVGVLPLVSQSMINNLQGNTASFQTSSSVDGTEQLLSVPFNAPELAIAVGSTTLVAQDVFTLYSNRWIDKALFDADSQGDLQQFLRTATLEQFGASDLDTDDSFDTPLDGGTDPGSVHFKRVRMQIRDERSFLDLPGARTGSYEIVAFTTY
jgi:Tfp pilus assembly protein PilV